MSDIVGGKERGAQITAFLLVCKCALSFRNGRAAASTVRPCGVCPVYGTGLSILPDIRRAGPIHDGDEPCLSTAARQKTQTAGCGGCRQPRPDVHPPQVLLHVGPIKDRIGGCGASLEAACWSAPLPQASRFGQAGSICTAVQIWGAGIGNDTGFYVPGCLPAQRSGWARQACVTISPRQTAGRQAGKEGGASERGGGGKQLEQGCVCECVCSVELNIQGQGDATERRLFLARQACPARQTRVTRRRLMERR